jgi:hypothetical protein
VCLSRNNTRFLYPGMVGHDRFGSGLLRRTWMSQFEELLSQHIASSLLKQYALGEFLGDHYWNVDMRAGTVDFGEGRVYPIQIIGTESEVNGTWLWAWANKASNIPEPLLICANSLRELGTQAGIEALTAPQLELDEVDGHLLTMLACGVCNADAYYAGGYEGGAAFFLIQQSPLSKQPPVSPMEHINVMSSVISDFPVNHRLMARSFLQQQGYTLTESADEIVATASGSQGITVRFDTLDRISGMETTVTPR